MYTTFTINNDTDLNDAYRRIEILENEEELTDDENDELRHLYGEVDRFLNEGSMELFD